MKHDSKTYLIFGISKGLGKALTVSLPNEGDVVFGVSRTAPAYGNSNGPVQWIQADLSHPVEACDILRNKIGTQKIDYFIYNVGIWEHNGFSERYDFEKTPPQEIMTIIQTNLTSCILTIQEFIPNLRLSLNPKIIFIGSTWGLDHHNGKEVAFAATKFGLRGVIHSLRENLRSDAIGVSILNLGYLATEFDIEVPVERVIAESHGELIPLWDVINAIRFITSTSRASCVKEIHMPAMLDQNV